MKRIQYRRAQATGFPNAQAEFKSPVDCRSLRIKR
jgi:hypothetical protein